MDRVNSPENINPPDFTCEKCGECCKVDGYVYLKKGEAEKIAQYIAIPVDEFKRKFTDWRMLQGRVLKQVGTECVFLVDRRCVVYPARPVQCSSFPYWKHVINDSDEWEHLKTFCPGVRNTTDR